MENDAPLFEDFEEISAAWWLGMGGSMLDDYEYGLVSAVFNAASSKYTPQETLESIRSVIEADVRDYVNLKNIDADDEMIMVKTSDEDLKYAVLALMKKAYKTLAEQLGA